MICSVRLSTLILPALGAAEIQSPMFCAVQQYEQSMYSVRSRESMMHCPKRDGKGGRCWALKVPEAWCRDQRLTILVSAIRAIGSTYLYQDFIFKIRLVDYYPLPQKKPRYLKVSFGEECTCMMAPIEPFLKFENVSINRLPQSLAKPFLSPNDLGSWSRSVGLSLNIQVQTTYTTILLYRFLCLFM